MANEKIHINALDNTYWEITPPTFLSRTCKFNFICMGNSWIGDCETKPKDLFPSHYEQLKYFISFLNDRYNQTFSDFVLDTLKQNKFELFLKAINGFILSLEFIPGGYGFYFYPHPFSYNIPEKTLLGKVKFLGASFRIAEKKILVHYRDEETFEKKTQSLILSDLELVALKKVICTSILSYMKKEKKFAWNFYLSEQIKQNIPNFS